jgi:heparan-alpha-glucosaminide N-acetyltransferase
VKVNFSYVHRGYLGPGGIHDNGQFRGCVGGATGYLDRLVLGEKHIYRHPTARDVYGSGPFDPEGIVGKAPVVPLDWWTN